ncbi:uncharacterized protein [Haliotis asinina]|uniref:uncharacterized protein n=1 Tax=Haliotis asinina TaxID=109174 RepID=UPI003532564A
MDNGYHSRWPETRPMLAITRTSTNSSNSRSFLRQRSDGKDRKSQFHLAEEDRRLPPPAVFWSDNERDAYRKNRVIQSKLNSDLDDIQMHKQHSSRVIRCDAMRFKLRSSRFPHLVPLKFAVWGNYKQMPRSIKSGRVGNVSSVRCSPVGDDISSTVSSSPDRQRSTVHLTSNRQSTNLSLHRNSSLRSSFGEAQCSDPKRPETSPVHFRDVRYHTKYNESDDRTETSDNGSKHQQLEQYSGQNVSDNVLNNDTSNSLQDTKEGVHGHKNVSPSILSKKKVPRKTVRWSNPEYSLLRSKTTLDDPSTKSKLTSLYSPFRNLEKALSSEKLRFQDSQTKVSDYVRQLAISGFSRHTDTCHDLEDRRTTTTTT